MMARRTSPAQQLLQSGPSLLGRLVDEQEATQRKIWELGRDMVLAGTSYAALGRMLGVTAQASRQRFSRHVEAWRAEHGSVMPWDVDPSYGVDPWAAESQEAMLALLEASGGR